MPVGDKTRDPAVFTEFLRVHRSRVFGYLLALVHNLADAEDLYQQTTLLLWEKFDQYEPGTDFGSWASTVAHYTALNFLRRQSRRRILFNDNVLARLADMQSTLSDSEVSARSEALGQCLESLSSRNLRLLTLRYRGEQSMEEIAKQEDKSVASLYTALSRIRKSLLSCIEQRMTWEAT